MGTEEIQFTEAEAADIFQVEMAKRILRQAKLIQVGHRQAVMEDLVAEAGITVIVVVELEEVGGTPEAPVVM